jgi:hypothetical protein
MRRGSCHATIVSARPLPFQGIWAGGIVIGRETNRGRSHRLYRELLFALESARSRLAVAIAAENKVTPRDRWRYYLETEDRTRRCVREMRRLYGRGTRRRNGWLQALSLLKQPLTDDNGPSRGEAQQLCQRLSEVLHTIEGGDSMLSTD